MFFPIKLENNFSSSFGRFLVCFSRFDVCFLVFFTHVIWVKNGQTVLGIVVPWLSHMSQNKNPCYDWVFESGFSAQMRFTPIFSVFFGTISFFIFLFLL